MAVAMIGPKFYAWDRNGKPLAFGKLYTYQARTNVPKPTYQSEDQQVENTNPVILNGEGYADIYLDGSYKMVLKDDKDNEIWSSDPVTSAQAEEWVNCVSATYISPVSFKISGNFTSEYNAGRKVRLDSNDVNFDYGTIKSSYYSGGETFVEIYEESVKTGLSLSCVSVVGVESSFNQSDLIRFTDYAFSSVQDMITGEVVGGQTIEHKIGQIYSTGGTKWVVTQDVSGIDLSEGLYAKALSVIHLNDFSLVDDGTTDNFSSLSLAFSQNGLFTISESGDGFFSSELPLPEEFSLTGIGNPKIKSIFSITKNLTVSNVSFNESSLSCSVGSVLGKILVEDCIFDLGQQAINIDSGDGTTGEIESIIVRNNIFKNQSWRAVNIRSSILGHCHVDSNYIYNIGGDDFAEAIRIGTNLSPETSQGMMVTNNTIRDVSTTATNESHAIIVQGQKSIITGNEIVNVTNGSPQGSPSAAEAIYTKCYDSIVSDNIITNGVRGVEGAITIKGVDEPGALQFGSGCIVSNNQIRNTPESIGRGINVMVSNCSIIGNRVVGASSDGIGVMTLYDSDFLDGAGRTVISDNYVSSSGANGINARRLHEDVTIVGNIVTGAGSMGIQVESPSKGASGSRIACSNWLISKNVIDGTASSSLYLFVRDYTDLVSCVFSDNICNSTDRIMTIAGNPALASIANLTIRANTFTNYNSKITDNGFPVWGGAIANITGNDGLPTVQYGFHDFTVGQSGRKDVYFTPVGDGSTDYSVSATMSCSGDTFTRQYLTTSNRGANFIVLNINTADDSSNTVQTDCRVFYSVRHIADKG